MLGYEHCFISKQSYEFGAERAQLTVKLFTFYILVLTGYRSLLIRVEFRTAITRLDVSVDLCPK